MGGGIVICDAPAMFGGNYIIFLRGFDYMRLTKKEVATRTKGLTTENLFTLMGAMGLSLTDIMTLGNNLWFNHPDVELKITDIDVITLIEDFHIAHGVARGQEVEYVMQEIMNDENYHRVRRMGMEHTLRIGTKWDFDDVFYDFVLSDVFNVKLYYVDGYTMEYILDVLNQKCSLDIEFNYDGRNFNPHKKMIGRYVLKLHVDDTTFIFAYNCYVGIYGGQIREHCTAMQGYYYDIKPKRLRIDDDIMRKIFYQLYTDYCKKHKIKLATLDS